jgi:hypothetical protein
MYTDLQYAHSRLVETTILHQRAATLIHKVTLGNKGKLRLHGVELRANKEVADYIDNFDYEPPQLGFSNVPGHGTALYWMRKPMRKDWKQGIRNNNVYSPNNIGMRFDPRLCLDALEGIYPTLDECIKMNERAVGHGFRNSHSAFSRHFAISNDMKLCYKTHGQVGQLDANGNYLINAGFEWVEEVLQETLEGLIK